jgi:hypothetical protein
MGGELGSEKLEIEIGVERGVIGDHIGYARRGGWSKA